jgi:hypothetical protein
MHLFVSCSSPVISVRSWLMPGIHNDLQKYRENRTNKLLQAEIIQQDQPLARDHRNAIGAMVLSRHKGWEGLR